MTKNYNWKRFWCPREAAFHLGDDGFLSDPDSEFSRFLNPALASIETLHTEHCLILLGEPGIGKSYEIRNFSRFLEPKSEDESLFLDLKSFGEESRLYSVIFENEKFIKWVQGQNSLHLFLDSLDECLLRIRTVTSLLEDVLSRYPMERLFLRIACRTAEWPYSFEKALAHLYGNENVKAFELVPLRKKDVHSAAESEAVANPDKFVELVISNNAVPFAIKPVTLDMLIRIYKTGGALPAKQSDLYEKGCLLLCQEPSERRRDTGNANNIRPSILLTVASRIATTTIFGNKYAIWTDIDLGDVPKEDVQICELAGGSETVDGESISVTEELINAAIRTGLFTSRGPHRMGWAHQTYAEFLASRYLLTSSLSENKIIDLLVNPSDTHGKIVPQLYETAAWVANADTNILTRLLESDPEVLLRSDVASFDCEDRKRLVEKLLALFREGKLLDRDIYQYYRKLNHHLLAEQVLPYIEDKNQGFLVRRVAIDIAEACEVKAVLPNLIKVALDRDENLSTRKNASYAITRIGDKESKAKLKPFILGGADDDPDDELKGCALKACWPDAMTAEELFTALTPRKNPNLAGSYSLFLYDLPDSIEKTIQLNDLPSALEWVAVSANYAGDFHDDFNRLSSCIMQIGWEYLLENPELAKPFAKAVVKWLLVHYSLPMEDNEHSFGIKKDDKRRLLVLSAALESEDISENNISNLALSQIPLVTSEDIPWFIQKFMDSGVETRKKVLKLFSFLVSWTDSKHLDDILEAREQIPEFKKELSWLDPVEIDSPEGRKQKAKYLKHLRLEKRLERHRNLPLLKPSPIERVQILLDKFEKGEKDAWWQLNREMTLKPNSRYYDGASEFESDLTKLPVWEESDEELRERLIRAAKEYVLHPPEMDLSWLGTNTVNRPHWAGYRALILLMKFTPDFVSRLPANSWKIWAPIVVYYPLNTIEEKELHGLIVSYCYNSAPDEVINALIKIIRKENEQNDHVFITRKVEHCFDQRLGDAILNEIRSQNMGNNTISDLLDFLMDRGFAPAIEYAKTEIPVSLPQEQTTRARVLVITESLFGNYPGIAWPTIWPCIQADTQFGRELFERFADRYRHKKQGLFVQQLSEQQLGDMYLWLAEQYPYHEDPKWEGVHCIGPRESIAEFRDGLLNSLRNRGTKESLQQIRRTAEALPQLSWLKWTILEAEKNTRAKTWRSLTPQQIISLAQDSHRTFIESGTQLLNVISESLDRLEQRLHGELPAIYDLWDNRGDNRKPSYCPKDEPHLSDYITRHLLDDLSRQRGIIVNREVQIRRGQETDIHIDAINLLSGGQVDIIKAIIEVKGCWNPDLETAMDQQLVGRYLQDHQCPYGIYLIGWFACDKWTDNDYRKKQSPQYPLEHAISHFEEQAKEISAKSSIPGLALKAHVLDAHLRT
jgi:hypothetical protein